VGVWHDKDAYRLKIKKQTLRTSFDFAAAYSVCLFFNGGARIS
jgi:hypothetical protein